jgi:hypothetical protein
MVCEILPGISDHKSVQLEILWQEINTKQAEKIKRWQFNKVDRSSL